MLHAQKEGWIGNETAYREAIRCRERPKYQDVPEEYVKLFLTFDCPECQKKASELTFQFCTNMLTKEQEEKDDNEFYNSPDFLSLDEPSKEFSIALTKSMRQCCMHMREGYVSVCDDCEYIVAHILTKMS